jgi:arylsulfatase A-like enzyme
MLMRGIHGLIVLSLAGLVLAVPGSAAVEARPPNIVVFLADDLGWGDLERHGGPARTPAIDRLAAEGVELRRCYAHPVCSPTRAALLTGCLPRRFGIARPLGRRDPGLPAGLPTLPRTLSAAGYSTNLVGKWHLGTSSLPLASGFDHFYGFLGPEIDSFTHLDRRGGLDWQRDEMPVEEEGYAAILMADEAVRIIQRCDADRPFYLQVAFNVPHFPILAPAGATAKYAGLPEPQATRCGMIDVLDTGVARVLAALDARGLAEETIVLFLSDNGADRSGSNAPFRARKGTVYEGGIRVPAIVRFPGRIQAATVSEQPIAIQDLFPTLCAATGIPLPADARCDGVDLWPALSAGRVDDRPPFVIATADRACFAGDWKLVVNAAGGTELFHLRSDPGETRDLLAAEPGVAAILRSRLAEIEAGFEAPAGRASPLRRGQGEAVERAGRRSGGGG